MKKAQENQITPITQPFSLHHQQVESLKRMEEMGSSILALQPGLGKTRTVLEHARKSLLNNTRNLFIIPKTARASFEKELLGRNCLFIDLKNKTSVTLAEMENAHFLIVENTMTEKVLDKLKLLCMRHRTNLYVDEAHSIQSSTSKLSKTLLELRELVSNTILVTASPLLNSIEGLFNVYRFAYPQTFKSWFYFRDRYCTTKERTVRVKGREHKFQEITGYKNLDKLSAILDNLTIKGKRDYTVDYKYLDCALNEESVESYHEASEGLFNIDGEDEKAFATRIHDLQRIVDGQFLEGTINNKIESLCSVIKEITDRNEAGLIYFEYKDSLELVKEELLKRQKDLNISKISVITGEQKESERQKIEKSIIPREFVLCTQAAGESRNLQKANNLIMFNIPFSIGAVIQLVGRICRCDTAYDVQHVYLLNTKKTVDEYKVRIFQDKLSLIDKILGEDCKGTLTCPYLEIDRNYISRLRNSLLWRR